MHATIELCEAKQLQHEGPAFNESAPAGRGRGASSSPIEVAFVNMMPDPALERTERQFAQLLGAEMGGKAIQWRKFALPGVSRSAPALQYLRQFYTDFAELRINLPDTIVVTGAEPKMPDLRDEPYWPELVNLLDWASRAGVPVLLSCLAAHAAVLYFDGIVRRPLATKRSGVFDHVRASDSEMTSGIPFGARVAHSRWNEVGEDALVSAGYEVLTRSQEAGVDMFTKRSVLFCQGHPEYDPVALLREYRRDIGRYLNGDRATYPTTPQGYFDAPAQHAIVEFRRRAEMGRDAALLPSFPYEALRAGLDGGWHLAAADVVRRWLLQAVTRREAIAV